MIVDDDRLTCWALAKTFEAQGWQTASYGSAEAALDRLERDAPDVLVADVHLPGMDGVALLAEVKRRRPELPVIVISGLLTSEIAERSLALGAEAALGKPVDLAEITARVTAAAA